MSNKEMLVVIVLGLAAIAGFFLALPGTIVAFGTAGSILAGTIAVTANPWVAPVTAIGISLTGVTVFVRLLHKVSKEAKEDPYEWVVPLLGIAGALIIDTTKEYAIDNTVLRIIVGAVIAVLVVVAANCYKMGGWRWRTVAFVLLLAPPLILLGRNLTKSGSIEILKALKEIPTTTWLSISFFLVLAGCVVVLQQFSIRRRVAHY